MIRVKCLSGPYAGRSRFPAEDVNPPDLLGSFLQHGWQWEVDYSQATGVEILRWFRADLGARAIRAMRKGLQVSFMGKVYSDPMELEDAITYSGRGVSLGRDDESGVEITDHDLQEPEPLALHRQASEWIEVHCQELLEAGKDVPSWQKKNAFARTAAALVTGLPLGTVGGPTAREHAALRQLGQSRWTFEEVVGVLGREDGLMFGPLTDLHRQVWVEEFCFDDDPDDVVELVASTGKKLGL